MSVDALFNRTCTVNRWSPRGADADYVLRADWQPHLTGVRYALQERAGVVSATAAGRQVVFDAVGYFTAGVDLVARADAQADGDQVVDDATGAVYFVVAVVEQTGRGAFLKALLSSKGPK